MHPVTQTTGLRERKRLSTLRRVHEEALTLVERHGYNAVTVEDICAAADISRRTFFNYVSSKDEAIIGSLPFKLDAAGLDAIETTESDNLVALILSHLRESDSVSDPRWLERRRAVISANPQLAHAAHNRRTGLLEALAVSVEKHFARFPGDRRMAEYPVELEVHNIVEICRSALSLYLSNPHFPVDGCSPLECVRRAARIHAAHCSELPW